MILYTIIPEELIFKNQGDNTQNTDKEIDYLGEKVIVTPLPNNEFQINRIISTSLKAYLDPRLQPGNIIKSKI
ncbi:MAG TPA: YlzJ-like family protein [Clostridia bacterium]|nr:YlzJ-like family protein [Clostridia bacterium]